MPALSFAHRAMIYKYKYRLVSPKPRCPSEEAPWPDRRLKHIFLPEHTQHMTSQPPGILDARISQYETLPASYYISQGCDRNSRVGERVN